VIENDRWQNWSELYIAYRQSRLSLEEFIREENQVINKDTQKVVILELARSMRSDLTDSEREIYSRIKYAMNTISDEDMVAAGLSNNELKITKLRQSYSSKQVSEFLKVTKRYVNMVYQSAVDKVLKYKKDEEQDKALYKLSPQQKEIIVLMDQGKSHQEIVIQLGISSKTLTTQKQRIKKKISQNKEQFFT